MTFDERLLAHHVADPMTFGTLVSQQLAAILEEVDRDDSIDQEAAFHAGIAAGATWVFARLSDRTREELLCQCFADEIRLVDRPPRRLRSVE